MTINVHGWDSQTKQRLFGLGVEAYIMSMEGRYSNGGPFVNVSDNWRNNIDNEELAEVIESWTAAGDPSDVLAAALSYIKGKETVIHNVVTSTLDTARSGEQYWMFI